MNVSAEHLLLAIQLARVNVADRLVDCFLKALDDSRKIGSKGAHDAVRVAILRDGLVEYGVRLSCCGVGLDPIEHAHSAVRVAPHRLVR